MIAAVSGGMDRDDVGRKRYRGGTHRTVAPAETLARIHPLLPGMGITRVANVTGLDRVGVPVVMVCRPNARSIAVSQGKGLDLTAAKASGVMEAVEAYHAEHITLSVKLNSYDELRGDGHALVDVARLPHSTERRFEPDLPMLWIEGRDLIEDVPVWLPHELVGADYTLPLPPGSGCFPATTNGLGSGNHPLEAIAHGICEVIERDATALWKLRGDRARRETGLDLDTVDDPACREVLARFERAEVDVRAWETTSDVGVPSFLCLVLGRRDESADPEFGAGCHAAREVALLRALTEAAQARLTYIAGSRDDFAPDLYTPSARAGRLRGCRLWLEPHRPGRDFRTVPSWDSETFADDVAELLRRLRSVGVGQVIAVDLTKPAFGLPVVRVVVPGLEGPYRGERSDYVPGARALAALKADA